MRTQDTLEYAIIRDFYNNRRAKRSGVRLINHINEGIYILDKLNANLLTKRAYCLHPIVQNNEPCDVSKSSAYALACEYRDKANAYLCRPVTDHVKDIRDVHVLVGDMSLECAQMLFADKLQNFNDFMIYHYGNHDRSFQLYNYFHLWLKYLTTYYIKGPFNGSYF